MIRFRSHLTRPGCVATVVGLFLLSVGVFYLMWNERTHRESEHFISLARLYTVKVYGHLVPGDAVYDPLFGVGGDYLSVHREVQYYQWEETTSLRKEDDRSNIAYSYKRAWYGQPIASDGFMNSSDHTNTVRFTLPDTTFYSRGARINDYLVCHAIIDSVPHLLQDSVTLDTASDTFLAGIAAVTHHDSIPWCRDDNCVFFGEDPDNPQVGDVRVVFRLRRSDQWWHVFARAWGEHMNVPDSVYPQVARLNSVGGMPMLKALVPLEEGRRTLLRVNQEPFDGVAVINAMHSDNNTLHWLQRFMGWILLALACRCLLGLLLPLIDNSSVAGLVAPDWSPWLLSMFMGFELALGTVLLDHWLDMLPI